MQLQYLYHSGFRVETGKHLFIFDYFEGKVSLSEKPTYVFSSHAHSDHYNPQIFNWQANKSDIHYILSDDIPLVNPNDASNYGNLSQSAAHNQNVFLISPCQELQIQDVKIKTFGSTDEGVSFLVEADGINIFHAGDLNWWYWWGETPEEIAKAEKLFKQEITKIKGRSIDIAFFPVDQRLEHNYCLGANYFIQEVAPKYLVPMHYWDDPETPRQFAEQIKESPTKVITFEGRGDDLLLGI